VPSKPPAADIISQYELNQNIFAVAIALRGPFPGTLGHGDEHVFIMMPPAIEIAAIAASISVNHPRYGVDCLKVLLVVDGKVIAGGNFVSPCNKFSI